MYFSVLCIVRMCRASLEVVNHHFFVVALLFGENSYSPNLRRSSCKSYMQGVNSVAEDTSTKRKGVVHKCEQCAYSTSKKSNLTVHKRSHDGAKIFKCPSCDYAATQKEHLVVHLRTHTGERPFKVNDEDIFVEISLQSNADLDTVRGVPLHIRKKERCDPPHANTHGGAAVQMPAL